MKDAAHLTSAFRKVGPKLRDTRIRELLDAPLSESPGGVTIQLDFNARLVTALREQRLWPKT